MTQPQFDKTEIRGWSLKRLVLEVGDIIETRMERVSNESPPEDFQALYSLDKPEVERLEQTLVNCQRHAADACRMAICPMCQDSGDPTQEPISLLASPFSISLFPQDGPRFEVNGFPVPARWVHLARRERRRFLGIPFGPEVPRYIACRAGPIIDQFGLLAVPANINASMGQNLGAYPVPYEHPYGESANISRPLEPPPRSL